MDGWMDEVEVEENPTNVISSFCTHVLPNEHKRNFSSS
jgi:hypothetical protein